MSTDVTRRLSGEREAWRQLAVHEAAHAVTAVALGAEVAWVDLGWRPGTGGTAACPLTPHLDAVIALAGYEASGGALTGQLDTHDTRIALELVGPAGVEPARGEARALLAMHRPLVIRVAGDLLDAGRLTGAEVVALVPELRHS